MGMSRSLTLILQIAVIFAETLDILLGALEVLIEESEPLGLRVSRVKTKIQAFNDILDAAVLSDFEKWLPQPSAAEFEMAQYPNLFII